MLRLLGAWNLPPKVRFPLVLAIALVILGFLANVVARAVSSGPLLILSVLLAAAGAACGISAAVMVGRATGP